MTQKSGGVFVTGTDTGVGKTWVSAMIARELVAQGVRVGVFKPACSGAELRSINGDTQEWIWPDLEVLLASSRSPDGIDSKSIEDICPYRLEAPLAPPVAARQAGIVLDFETMLLGVERQQARSEFMVVEGVGGWLCPLTDTHTIADFAAQISLPVVVVARLGLGTLNHTLLTVDAIQRRGLAVAGVIINDAHQEASSVAATSNPAELDAWLQKQAVAEGREPVRVLGVVPFGGASVCLSGTAQPARIDWLGLGHSRDESISV